MTGLTYDSFNLQTGGVVTTETTIYSAPRKTIQAEKLAESDGSVIVKTSYDSKTFNCEGYMTASTNALLDTLIDTFKTALNKTKANLDIDYGVGSRRYVSTPQNIIITRDQGLNRAGWSGEFFCESPVGSDTSSSTLITSTAITTNSLPIALTVAGSYMAEPLITYTLTSVTGGTTNKTITLSNGTTQRGISITRDWVNGDVLEVDSLNKTVYVNSIAVESSGLYPTWEPGAGSLNYNDDFTTRSATLTATYTKRYI